MNSRKIFLSILLLFVLAGSLTFASASEIAENGQAIAQDEAIIQESDLDVEEVENIQSSAEAQDPHEILETISEEKIISSSQEDVLSANKKDLEIWVRGGTVKEGDNISLEICFLEKAEYYTEESGIAHPINNVVITAGNQTHTLNIPSGEYEEDGIYLELGNDFKSGNYTVTVTIPQNSYYNAKTFTFNDKIRILSETNKGDIEINKEDIYGSDSFEGEYGYVWMYLYGSAYGLNLTGEVKVTLTNSNATRTYTGAVNDYEVKVMAGNDLPSGTYSIKVQYLGNSYYNPTSTVTSSNKFIVYDSSNKIPVDDVWIKITNTVKGQNGTIKLDVSDDKIANISMAGKAQITLKKGKTVYKTYAVNIDQDGLATLKLGSDLAAGNYSVTAKYYGNSYYNAHTESYGTFYIFAKSNKILIKNIYSYEIQDTGKGSNGCIKIDMSSKKKLGLSMAGTLTFTLTKDKTVKTYTMNIDENGTGTKMLGGNLASGKYAINIISYDTTFYSIKAQELDYFHVYYKDYKVPIYDTYVETFNTVKGQNGTFKIDMSSYKVPGLSMAGTANVILNNVTYKVQIDKNGFGSIKLGDKLAAGRYAAKIQYLGNSYYKKSDSDGYYFKVFDKSYKIPLGGEGYYLTVCNAALNHNASILYNLSEYKINNAGMAGNVKITIINDERDEYYYNAVLDDNGILSLKFGDDLPLGNYSIEKIEYAGNDYYSNYTILDENRFQICSEDNKADIGNIGGMEYYGRLSSAAIKEGDNTTLSLDFSRYKAEGLSMETTVTIRLSKSGSKKYDYSCAINENGTGTLIFGDDLAAGRYSIEVLPFESDYYISEYARDIYLEDFKELYLNVDLKNKTGTSIAYSNAKGNADPNCALFKFTLKDAQGRKLVGKTVEVKFNGKTYYTVTDENGKVSFKAYAKAAKKYPIYVTFKGDDIYNLKTIKGTVKISKNKVKFSSATKKVKRSAAKRKFKITLKTSNKKALAKKLVYIKINKKTYKAKTNAKGVAVFKLKLAKKKKTYKYTVSFKGDKANAKKTYKGKLKVY